jgi:uncharacterized membrane-anchored protein
MKYWRIVIFILIAAAQLAVPASMVWKRGRTLAYGRVWKFKTEPIDPVDAIRGRYIALRLEAEKVSEQPEPSPGKIKPDTEIYATLKEDADGFARVDKISETKVSGDDVVEAKLGYWSGGWQYIRFPFDKLWVAETIAPQAEQAYRENSPRGKENAYVTVRVRDGDAALDQLYIDNKPLAEYLRAQAAGAPPRQK